MTKHPLNAIPNPSLLPWLNHHDSLTDKLKTFTPAVKLNIIRHEWGLTDAWDQQELHLQPQQRALHREITMQSDKNLCWYARTTIPERTYQAKSHLFAQLETEPLGHLIWNNADIKRTSLHYYPINSNSMEYTFLNARMHQHQELLWARRSLIMVHAKNPLYLLEIFLPGLDDYCS